METNLLFRERIASHGNQEFKIGDYAFADGSLSADPQFRNLITGIVVWKNPIADAPIGQRGIIMMPEEKLLAWAKEWYGLGGPRLDNGYANTYNLLEVADERKIKLPAMQYCADYCQNGVQAGEGFGAALRQMEAIAKNRLQFVASLERIRAVAFDKWYWTSSTTTHNNVWLMHPESNTDTSPTNFRFYVRCLVAF